VITLRELLLAHGVKPDDVLEAQVGTPIKLRGMVTVTAEIRDDLEVTIVAPIGTWGEGQ
jgi:hypothetical protein